MFDVRAGYIVVISGGITVLLRVLPFIFFGRSQPAFIVYLGRVLPPAVMGMLAVYCLRGVNFLAGTHGVPEVCASLLVIVLQVWKRNTLLSIVAGTALYMFMVQGVSW